MSYHVTISVAAMDANGRTTIKSFNRPDRDAVARYIRTMRRTGHTVRATYADVWMHRGRVVA